MKQVYGIGTVLVVSLVASYLEWTSPEGEAPGSREGIPLIRTTAETLSSVAWRAEDKHVTITRKTDKSGSYLEVSETTLELVAPDPVEEVPAEEAGDPNPISVPAGVWTETGTTVFIGNDAADTVWENFAPLTAIRQLPEGSTPDAFGLASPKATLTVDAAGNLRELAVGGDAYGTRDSYVGVDGNVYLVDDKTLKPLAFAKSRLMERRLHPLDEKELRSLTVGWKGERDTWILTNADDAAKRAWAHSASPETRDDVAGTWIGSFLRIRLSEYLASPPEEALTEVFSVQLEGTTGPWTVTILSTGGEDAAYYAQSSYNRGMVSITRSLAQDAIADVGQLFDPRTSEEPEPDDAPESDDAPTP